MAKISKIQRLQVHSKFDGCCAYCGESIELKSMQVDHVIPQSDFINNIKGNEFEKTHRIPDFLKHLGSSDINHPDNLFPACRVCNNWKSWHSLEFFRSEISLQVTRLRRDSSAFRMAERYGLVGEIETKIEFYFEQFENNKSQKHG